MDEKESRTRKKLTRSDKDSKKDPKKMDTDIKKMDKIEPKKTEKQELKKSDKHKYPLTHVPSKSFVSMYVSKECEDLLWASIRSRH